MLDLLQFILKDAWNFIGTITLMVFFGWIIQDVITAWGRKDVESSD